MATQASVLVPVSVVPSKDTPAPSVPSATASAPAPSATTTTTPSTTTYDFDWLKKMIHRHKEAFIIGLMAIIGYMIYRMYQKPPIQSAPIPSFKGAAIPVVPSVPVITPSAPPISFPPQ